MIIGNRFSKKYHQLLLTVGELSEGSTEKQISVQRVNKELQLDRTEIKNVLEYLQDLDYISIETIGGPYLYGHITITKRGLHKYGEIS